MKILNNKNLTQKIIIAIIIMLSFNFIAPTYSRADVGGVLFGPVIDLFAGVLDALMSALQVFMDGGDNELLKAEGFLVDATKFDPGAYDMQAGSGLESVTIDGEELDHGWWGRASYGIPIIKYSPEKIFSNEVPALDANFINPKTDGYSEAQQKKSIALQLQETISSWYNVLRNLVIVILLSMLLYIGIRMMLTSIASDKSKYKQMLMDWLIALCLLFFLHYIMSFTMTFVQIITDGLKGATDINITINDAIIGKSFTYKTNLTGYCRVQIGYEDLGKRLVFLLFYIGLVVYTFMFTWKYMKRAITMAFLTLIAPVVTLTYPIDKMGDGKAQAFNMWLKEYIFNALLQPFHLIIYTVFLGASMNIAIENPIYAIFFLAFITPAEKILRKFFKFDQVSTAGASFAGAFGGAAAFNMIKGAVTKGATGAKTLTTGANAGKQAKNTNIRQKDRNAPNGKLNSFLDKTGSADQNKDGIDYTRAAEARRLRDEGIAEEDITRQLDTTLPFDRNQGSNTSEDDKRGVLQWGRDVAKEKWDNSQMKQNVGAFKRKVGEKTMPIRQMAGNLKDGAGKAIGKVGDTYRKIPKPIRNTLGRAGTIGARSIKGAVGTLGHVAVGAGKTAVGLGVKGAAAAAMGAVGVATGIAGDDLEDVMKLGLAGASLGWSTGSSIAGGIASGVVGAGSGMRGAYETSAYGHEEAALRQQEREFAQKASNREYFRNSIEARTGHAPSHNALNQTMRTAAQYDRAGITDLEQIDKSIVLEQELQKELREGTSMSQKDIAKNAREQAMTIAHLANSVDVKDLRDPKKRATIQQSFERELKSKDSSMTDKAAEAQAGRIMSMIMNQKGTY